MRSLRGSAALVAGAVLALALLTGRPVEGQSPAPAPPRIALAALIPGGLNDPLYLTHSRDDSGRLFIVEQRGRIWVIENGRRLGRPFLDISSRVAFTSLGERGLLGLTFHPQFRVNRRFFVNYTRVPDGATMVAEYRVSNDPTLAERSERQILVIPQPHDAHNGGMIEFGPDGLLYIAMGDGGPLADPQNRAQDLNQLLGKLLRIDVDRAQPYEIPADNPFIGKGRPEIWALGFRNPFRFSFDRQTGELYVGDVGEHRMEEVDLVERGRNYGWSIMEGSLCYKPMTGCRREGLELPLVEYARPPEHGLQPPRTSSRDPEGAVTVFHHPQGRSTRCAIIGGYVYRGSAIPDLVGTYVFGDLCSGEVFGLTGGRVNVLAKGPPGFFISSFGEDQVGDIYVVGLQGSVHRIVGQ